MNWSMYQAGKNERNVHECLTSTVRSKLGCARHHCVFIGATACAGIEFACVVPTSI